MLSQKGALRRSSTHRSARKKEFVCRKNIRAMMARSMFVAATVALARTGWTVAGEPAEDEDSILHQIFRSDPPHPHALDEAWERHPLLSKLEPAEEGGGDNSILTILSSPTEREARTSFFSSIFSLDALDTVLSSDPQLDHGTDYKILKKVWRDGEEWSGILPLSGVLPPERIFHAIRVGKFSLVVDALQRRWTPVTRVTRALERQLPRRFSPDADIPVSYVSCNLYFTPEPDADDVQRDSVSGFEVHWDWMDVVVLQISGSKRWTVASEPLVALSTPDLKRKPSPQEVASVSYYHDFMLHPGDALYIPRGFMHNASVAGEDTAPSLHLTFGVEHSCYTTLEALIQVALHLFDMQQQQLECANEGQGDEETCSDDYTPPWEKIMLHYGISEVSRRDVLEKGRENTSGYGNASLEHRAGPLLRRSMLSFAVPQQDVTAPAGLDEAYTQALDYIQTLSTLEKTATFAAYQRQMFENPDAAQSSTAPTSFCYVAMPDTGPPLLQDIQNMANQPDAPQRYNAFLREFASFARANFDQAVESASLFNSIHRDETRSRDNEDLRRVGQTV